MSVTRQNAREIVQLDFLREGGDAGALMRAQNWSASPLGCPQSWPQSLRSVIELLLHSKFPMFVAWGPELTFLYNDPYAAILGAKHPRAMGQPFKAIWGEIWPSIAPLIEAALAGKATYKENLPLLMHRNGYDEETWFTFSYSPVRDEEGRVAGMFCACTETTSMVLAERRQAFRLSLEQQLRELADAAEVIHAAAAALGQHLSAARVGYAELEADGKHVVVGREWRADGTPTIAGRHRLADYGPDFVAEYQAGRTVVIHDIAADPRSAGTNADLAHAALGIRAQVVVPIIKAGQLNALLFVHSSAPRQWVVDDLALIEDVAERIWAMVERVRAETRLRISEARLRFLSKLDEALREARDAEAAMSAVTELLGQQLSASRIAYATVDADNDTFKIGSDYNAPGVATSAGTYSLDLFGPRAAAAMRLGRTLVIRDIAGELDFGDGGEMFSSIGIAAIICCPLVKDGRLVAMMAAHQDHPRGWEDDEVSLVETVVERCWGHVQRVGAEARLRDSEAKFHAIANSIDQMVWSTRPDGFHDYFNDRWYEYTGVPQGSTDGKAWNEVFHAEDRQRASALWQHSLQTGDPYHIEYRLRHASGEYRWVIGRALPVRDEHGAIVRWYGTCTDVHDLKLAEEALRKSRDQLAAETQALAILNNTGREVAAELRLDALVQRVVDAGVALTGARFGAFFYNVLDDTGEHYTLYSLSGAKRSDFENFGMPRATAVFAPTFHGEDVIRSDDILADERYGKNPPHKGMPTGHLPVRSYLAVPVTSRSGEVIGGLFFGHEETGVFSERAEQVMVGLAAQAAIGLDNARLFEQVQRANIELEERVRERTAELEAAHEALRQSQKMEAVGQLTGGIAHDFNNMLAVVIGSLDLLGRRLGTGDPRAKRYADAATDGAKRAALLTQRLLAFSRQQPLRPEAINVNQLVGGMSDLLRHSLGAHVQLETVLAGGLWRTHADPNQLENVILNLAVNARDAMPDGGRLTIETQNAHLDDRYAARHLGVPAGQYVLIAVTDNGAGMPEEVIAKAFDPFFTTKEVGRGTGLGLSQVYGFVKQSGGHVKIYSELRQGTTVKVYLPRLMGSEHDSVENDTSADLPLGDHQEVILVVEDEAAVRQFSVDALTELGYHVLEADGAAAALRLLDAHPEIALLFTDVVMPDVNGRKLADEVLRRRPNLPVLFTTGYTRNAVVHNGVLDVGVELIGKPFTVEELAAKVRSVLDRGR